MLLNQEVPLEEINKRQHLAVLKAGSQFLDLARLLELKIVLSIRTNLVSKAIVE
jgi:hypothetical protein